GRLRRAHPSILLSGAGLGKRLQAGFPWRLRSALESAAESGTAQEGALEDQKAQDGNERCDQHRGEEHAELRLRLDSRKPHRERLAIRAVREDQERPEEVPPLREDREDRNDSEDRLREWQHDREEET